MHRKQRAGNSNDNADGRNPHNERDQRHTASRTLFLRAEGLRIRIVPRMWQHLTVEPVVTSSRLRDAGFRVHSRLQCTSSRG
jgi:hypothetical protein